MVDIFITRRVGKYKAGQIVHNVELDAYWNAHIEAANALLLDSDPAPLSPEFHSDDDEDFNVYGVADSDIGEEE